MLPQPAAISEDAPADDYAGDPAAAWRDRQDNPEKARGSLRRYADMMSTHQLAEQCGTSFTFLNTFLRPGLSPAVFTSLDDYTDTAERREALVNILWAYRRAGWSGADLARAAGISRQRVSVLLKSAPTVMIPAPVKPSSRRRAKPAPNYRQVKSLPTFEVVLLDSLASSYLKHPSDPSAAELSRHAHFLTTTYRTPLTQLATHCHLDRGFFTSAAAQSAAHENIA